MLKKVENKDRYQTANKHYWYLYSNNKNYLFTDKDLEEAEDRAVSNSEDLPPYSFNYLYLLYLVISFVLGLVSAVLVTTEL